MNVIKDNIPDDTIIAKFEGDTRGTLVKRKRHRYSLYCPELDTWVCTLRLYAFKKAYGIKQISWSAK